MRYDHNEFPPPRRSSTNASNVPNSNAVYPGPGPAPLPESGTKIVTLKRVAIFAALAAAIGGGIYGVSKLGGSVSKLPADKIEAAKTKDTELLGYDRKAKRTLESKVLEQYGGQFYSMNRIPGLEPKKEDAKKTRLERELASKRNVYIRIPEGADVSRPVLYFHGSGAFTLSDTSMNNMNECMNTVKRPIIAPVDPWQTDYDKKDKDGMPESWPDFDDPNTVLNIVHFFEGQTGKKVTELDVAAFSAGIAGAAKLTRSITNPNEKTKEASEELNKLFHVMALYDAEDGTASRYIGPWMTHNPDARLFSNYNKNQGGITGAYYSGNKGYTAANEELAKKLNALEISGELITKPEEQSPKYSGRYLIEALGDTLRGHAVVQSKCEKYHE